MRKVTLSQAARPSSVTGLELLLCGLVCFFAVYAVGMVYVIKGESDARKAQPHAMLCFDAHGAPTLGEGWKECRTVAYRELVR